MRNPKRIKHILKKLEEVWKLYPDWRLGQLLFNIGDGSDMFFIEEEEWEELFDKWKLDLANQASR